MLEGKVSRRKLIKVSLQLSLYPSLSTTRTAILSNYEKHDPKPSSVMYVITKRIMAKYVVLKIQKYTLSTKPRKANKHFFIRS